MPLVAGLTVINFVVETPGDCGRPADCCTMEASDGPAQTRDLGRPEPRLDASAHRRKPRCLLAGVVS